MKTPQQVFHQRYWVILSLKYLQSWIEQLEQQTPIPPLIKDEATQKPKHAIKFFPSLIWGGGPDGGYKFPIYFVQDCSSRCQHKLPSFS